MNSNAPTSKVFYRPIEASLRWAGLLRFEHVILTSISSSRNLPQSLDCPRWGELRLYSDLADPRPIFDWMQVIRKRAIVYVGLDTFFEGKVSVQPNLLLFCTAEEEE
ncbi:MAG: hypothetical protein LCH72_08615 [Proteobacteria bacterium]|nr:hypothetical protein [Burkholderiales bacterium]MCA0310722.1 hypothetical protein [Pseudomonadota bacterium]